MTKGFAHINVGHAGALYNKHQHKRDASSTCSNGGFYISPSAGQSLDVSSSNSFNMTWDTSCLSTTAVDIYLYAPGANESLIHVWETVNYKTGNYQTALKPKWWNATASVQLQLSIVNSGDPPFLATMPAGPIFKATYTAPSSGSTPADADTTTADATAEQVNNLSTVHKGPTKGGVAAAVIFPLLFIGLLVAAYIRLSRVRGAEKRKRWSVAVDKRMSTISTDWKSISAAGASAAIRNSMAVSNRASVFGDGMRPSSSIAVEGGHAGTGARGLSLDQSNAPHMSQLRPGVRASAFGERVSRVSFAADDKLSGGGSRRSLAASRAFHTGFVPPLPERQNSGSSDEPVSPSQKEGPFDLTPEDIQARINGDEAAPRPSMDAMMPALSMMRTGGEDTSEIYDDYLLSPTLNGSPIQATYPTPPTPTYQNATPKSPIMGAMPMQPMPAAFMSPDDMLRAYAESRKAGGVGPMAQAAPTFPMPSYSGTGMRTLYSPPPTPGTPTSAAPLVFAGDNNPYRKSMAVEATRETRRSGEARVNLNEEEYAYGHYDVGTAE